MVLEFRFREPLRDCRGLRCGADDLTGGPLDAAESDHGWPVVGLEVFRAEVVAEAVEFSVRSGIGREVEERVGGEGPVRGPERGSTS